MSTRVDLIDLMDIPARGDMNDALRDWAAQAPHEGHPAERPPGQRSETEAACGICAKPARDACLRCDRPACPAHRGVMTGLCDRCVDAREERPEPAVPAAGMFDDEVEPEHPDVGIDWVE